GIDATGLKIDSVGPSVSRNAAADNCDTTGNPGWCRGSQSAGFGASDGTSGVSSPCSGASCNFTKSTTTNGSSVSIGSGSVCDNAGNCATAVNATGFQIDTVEPGITSSTARNSSATPGSSGWSKGTQ